MPRGARTGLGYHVRPECAGRGGQLRRPVRRGFRGPGAQARVLKRLHDERDLQRRCAIYSFPQQFSAAACCCRIHGKALGGSRFGESAAGARAVLHQRHPGGSPIDRVLGTLSRTFNLERKILPPAASSGKSFFINRLLHDVIFTEAGLAGGNEKKNGSTGGSPWARSPEARRSPRASWRRGPSATSSARWSTRRRRSCGRRQGERGRRAAGAGEIDIAKVVPVLNALRDLPSSASREAAVPVTNRFGLPGRRHRRAFIATYRRAERRVAYARVAAAGRDPRQAARARAALHRAARLRLMLHQTSTSTQPIFPA